MSLCACCGHNRIQIRCATHEDEKRCLSPISQVSNYSIAIAMPGRVSLMALSEIQLKEMVEEDAKEAADLVARAMNPDEGQWALETMRFHFDCARLRSEDGRAYFVWRDETSIRGLVGLHHYVWGPSENVWLGWFAVGRGFRRKRVGTQLMKQIERIAREKGYKKLFVETYSSDGFADARRFYVDVGFEETGRIADYMPDGSDMIVYAKRLDR